MESKNVYNSNVEADSMLQTLSYMLIQKKCPVFKKLCLGKRCMSFSEGTVYETIVTADSNLDTVFKIVEPCCLSPLVTGTIEVERDF